MKGMALTQLCSQTNNISIGNSNYIFTYKIVYPHGIPVTGVHFDVFALSLYSTFTNRHEFLMYQYLFDIRLKNKSSDEIVAQ